MGGTEKSVKFCKGEPVSPKLPETIADCHYLVMKTAVFSKYNTLLIF